eukprot:gb/GECG01008917.1/.p1 GENE.gb/GECG01008917.1/~~gb/GECG01008917.1/.p1  ORF type:complete len:135 (+),score=21.36 gb/GECG01008917.1/:1-405(+)
MAAAAATEGNSNDPSHNAEKLSIQQFSADKSLYIRRGSDQTRGYIVIFTNSGSCFGIVPFFFTFKLDNDNPEVPPMFFPLVVDANHAQLYTTVNEREQWKPQASQWNASKTVYDGCVLFTGHSVDCGTTEKIAS